MRYKGMQIICDRCGMTEFFVPLEKGSVDSSHSLSDYEGTKNWTNELIYGKYYDFCPLVQRAVQTYDSGFRKAYKFYY